MLSSALLTYNTYHMAHGGGQLSIQFLGLHVIKATNIFQFFFSYAEAARSSKLYKCKIEKIKHNMQSDKNEHAVVIPL